MLSIDCSESASERYVNYYELYIEQYRRNYLHALKRGYAWEHEDVVEVTERYCKQYASRKINGSASYSEKITLIKGPREFLLDRLRGTIRLGHEYCIELVVNDSAHAKKKVAGRIDLRSYVLAPDVRTGLSELSFENDDRLPLHWMKIDKNKELCLHLAGAIRLLSSVDYIINVRGDDE
ncbi:hypothetical protein [Pseudoalteromonas ruthenica]|uniref:hypothetical protein n=1 Tax=Pseudoalteromonas ruthenica TaxID=151081 RepID=UPI001109F4F2|nr:hypothetical protein [Pseudoalteromonas ruthenica]